MEQETLKVDFQKDFDVIRENAAKIPNLNAVLAVVSHAQSVMAPIYSLSSSSSHSPRLGSVYYASATKVI